jgi:threonine synthase
MEIQALTALSEGLYIEASSALGLAAAARLREPGLADADYTVVVIGTSSGLKDVGATADRLSSVPVLPPDLESLEALLL